jgi:hypothetical protein
LDGIGKGEVTTNTDGMPLAPSDAQRLSRLRALLNDARRRAGDESELGLHLAIVAIDGIGELAIGLCVQHLGVAVKPKEGVPGRLRAVTDALAIAPPGKKGYVELHRARNAVQHEGTLPGADQVPLWLLETERLIDALIKSAFGAGLDQVRSSDGVSDASLRSLLKQAEDSLAEGDSAGSFKASWDALETARRQFRKKSGFHPASPELGGSARSIIGQDRDLKTLLGEVRKLADQVEISAFTVEPGEWLWFKQRNGEIFRGLQPSAPDAGRAFAFVLSWILWYESYISRHGVDRWEQLREEESAPVTGIPGGPHIRDVQRGDRPSAAGGRTEGLWNWIFQLTDVPESHPSFDWAVHDCVDDVEGLPFTNAWMDGYGRLSVSFPENVEPQQVRTAITKLLEAAKEKLARREAQDAEGDQVRREIIARYEAGLKRVNCPVTEVNVLLPHGQHEAPADEVNIHIVVSLLDEDHGPSWFSKGCEETFAKHFPDESELPAELRVGFNDAVVPVRFDPEHVGRWVLDAIAFHEGKRKAETESRDAGASKERQALDEMRQLLEG